MEHKENPNENMEANNVFDILEIAGRVHSTSNVINRDFILACTDDKLEKLSRKLIYGAMMMYDLTKEVDEDEAKNQRDLLMHEVTVRLNQTRSRDGKVLDPYLKAPYANMDEPEKEQDTGAMGKLLTMFGGNKENVRE